MCTTCGCGTTKQLLLRKPGGKPRQITGMELALDHSHHSGDKSNKIIQLEKDILQANTSLAEENEIFFQENNIIALNLVSSPGSGKTSLLERTLTDLSVGVNFSVIEGDQQTMQDANRIDATNTPVIQINTGQACHLDGEMIKKAVQELKPKKKSILFIENVGNLVCPALFKLGEKDRIVILSVTEGDDKPLKYPDMFSTSDICIINKIDLLPYVNFDVKSFKDNALLINHHLVFYEVSATTGEGMEQWYAYLKDQLN